MNKITNSIKVIKIHSKEMQDDIDEYNGDPEECIEILEKLRQEAMVLLYGNKITFQRTINVVRRKQS
jgi:hypothetical protein